MIKNRIVKKFIGKFIPSYIKSCIKNFYILNFNYGQFKTIKNLRCIDKNSNPIPWYTYPAIEYLSTFDFSDKRIFEFGGGEFNSLVGYKG